MKKTNLYMIVSFLVTLMAFPVRAGGDGSEPEMEKGVTEPEKRPENKKSEKMDEVFAYLDNMLKDKEKNRRVGLGIWAGYSGAQYKDSRNEQPKDGMMNSVYLAAAYPITAKVVAGVYGMRIYSRSRSRPSSMPPTFGYSKVRNIGTGVMPFLAYAWNKDLFFKAHFGFIKYHTKIGDFTAITPPTHKKTSSHAYTVGLAAQYTHHWLECFYTQLKLGYTFNWVRQKQFDDVFGRTHDSQKFNVGVLDVAKLFFVQPSEYFTPFVGVLLSYDLHRSKANPALVMNPGFGPATTHPYQSPRKRFGYGFIAGVKAFEKERFTINAYVSQKFWGGGSLRTLSYGGSLILKL